MLKDIPIYVITMPQRREYVRHHMEERDIPWIEWKAFDGHAMGLATGRANDLSGHKDEFCPVCGEQKGPHLPPGHVGAVMSQLSLIKHWLASGVNEALLFEDDVILPADFRGKFDVLYSRLPSRWDMLYTFWFTAGHPMTPVADGLSRCSAVFSQAGVLYGRRAMEIFDATCQSVSAPLDCTCIQRAHPALNIYCATPTISSAQMDPSVMPSMVWQGKKAHALWAEAQAGNPLE